MEDLYMSKTEATTAFRGIGRTGLSPSQHHHPSDCWGAEWKGIDRCVVLRHVRGQPWFPGTHPVFFSVQFEL